LPITKYLILLFNGEYLKYFNVKVLFKIQILSRDL
jgi:hypothetical protein